MAGDPVATERGASGRLSSSRSVAGGDLRHAIVFCLLRNEARRILPLFSRMFAAWLAAAVARPMLCRAQES